MLRSFSRPWNLSFAYLVCTTSFVVAQPQLPPVQSNPQAPTINQPFPLGMQRGTAMDLTLAGANLAEPISLLASFPAKVTIPTENNNGKDAAKLLVRLEVPKNAILGWHTIRLATKHGISNFRLFCIDDLPQVHEQDTNRSPATAQAVSVPCLLCGRADPEVTDHYKFSVQAGQRVSFEVLGRRLGSGLDPMITIVNPRSGRQLAFADDSPGQGKDPRLTHTFKEPGDYILTIRDVRYQGGNDWYYRVRVGDFPCPTTPVPLAVKRGTLTSVAFAGPHVEGIAPIPVLAPQELQSDAISIWPTSPASGLPGWPVELNITDLDELLETEPNDEPAKANRIHVPAAINGRLHKPKDRDHFIFTAKKGQRLIIESNNQLYHSPTLVYLMLKDSKGADVAASDPKTDPARIDFTTPADGDYTFAIEHLNYGGSPEDSYRVTIANYEPGFTLLPGIDRFDVPQGASAIIRVQAARQGYTGPIEVSVAGPAGVSGTGTIPAGQNVALINLSAAADALPGGYRLQLVGRANINGKTVVERADVQNQVIQNLASLPFPPQQLSGQLAVAVTEKPPFTVQAMFDLPEGVRGLSVPVTVNVARTAGFDEEVTVTTVATPTLPGQPVPLPPATVKIPRGQTAAKLELKPAAQAALGGHAIGFTAKAGRFNTAAPLSALTLALPFDLKIDPAGGKMTVEGKHKIKVKATRKGGYTGPIKLELRNLPANVTAAAATIADKQTDAEIELTAAANAALGEKKDVNVLGTATAAANQQNPSPHFGLNVVKK